MFLLGWFAVDGLSIVEETLGLNRVEACKRYKLRGRFPPGPCRKILPEGATEFDGPPAPGKKVAKKPVLDQKIEKKVAKPVAPKPAVQPESQPGKQAVQRVSARKLFAPEGQREMKEVVDPAKLAALKEVFETSHAGMTSRISVVSASRNRVAVSGVIEGPDGGEIGSFETEFRLDRRGGMFADLGLLAIDPEFQGQGFAREFNNKSIGWYRDSGMERVQLFANIDIGALAWARAGWDWASRFDSAPLQDRLREMAGGKDRGAARLAGEMLERFDGAEFGTSGYPTPFELSEMGRVAGQGKGDTWPGKVLFRSHPDPEHPEHLGWNAELPLKGPRAVAAAAVQGSERGEMVEGLVAAHDRWVGRHLDSTRFEPHKDSKDFNLYFVDVDASGSAQDGLAAAMSGVLRGVRPTG